MGVRIETKKNSKKIVEMISKSIDLLFCDEFLLLNFFD